MKVENKNPVAIAIIFLILVIAINGAILFASGRSLAIQVSQVGDSVNALAKERAAKPNYPEIMTISEAAEYLQIQESDLSVLVENELIPYYEINNSKTMFSKTALLKWAAESAESRVSY